MKKIIVGNLKMNMTPTEFKSYAMTIATKAKGTKNTVVVCPPYTHLAVAKEILAGSKVAYGAQNISEDESGAITGEISANMIKDLGSQYVIIGHSERRQKFKENDKVINKKIKVALANGLKIVLCVGESMQTRADKQATAFVRKQIDDDLKGIYENELEGVVIAYEPIWAIGSGKNVTSKDIQKMVEAIRTEIGYIYSEKASKNIAVVYGGGVTMSNYKKILSQEFLNGALIGATCLDVDNFALIVRENY